MTITRSYIDQLLDPSYERTRIIGKSPYTLGYEAAAAGREPRQACPWPLHLPQSEEFFDGYANYAADQRRAGVVVAE